MPGASLSFDDLSQLVAAVRDELDSGVDGVVITQGTDTIEETAYFLDLTVNRASPVVVTGAMRNRTMAGADGPANLLAAVQTAASEYLVGVLGCGTLGYDPETERLLPHIHTSLGLKERSAVGHTSHLLSARVQFLVEMLLIEIATPAMLRTPEPALYDIPLLRFG